MAGASLAELAVGTTRVAHALALIMRGGHRARRSIEIDRPFWSYARPPLGRFGDVVVPYPSRFEFRSN